MGRPPYHCQWRAALSLSVGRRRTRALSLSVGRPPFHCQWHAALSLSVACRPFIVRGMLPYHFLWGARPFIVSRTPTDARPIIVSGTPALSLSVARRPFIVSGAPPFHCQWHAALSFSVGRPQRPPYHCQWDAPPFHCQWRAALSLSMGRRRTRALSLSVGRAALSLSVARRPFIVSGTPPYHFQLGARNARPIIVSGTRRPFIVSGAPPFHCQWDAGGRAPYHCQWDAPPFHCQWRAALSLSVARRPIIFSGAPALSLSVARRPCAHIVTLCPCIHFHNQESQIRRCTMCRSAFLAQGPW